MLRSPLLALICLVAISCTSNPPSQPWNRHARQFIWPPTLTYDRAAPPYRFRIVGSDGSEHVIDSRRPVVSLTRVWHELPVGRTTVDGRTFHRAAPFNGPYGKAELPYGESARVALSGLMREPFVKSFAAKGKPDLEAYPVYRYAAKVIGSL